MTKEDTLLKRDLLYFTTPETVDGYAKDVYEAMDEWAKQCLNDFGEYNLSRTIRYEQGLDKEWGSASYTQKVNLFLEDQKKQQ